jgi:hypothetical protein
MEEELMPELAELVLSHVDRISLVPLRVHRLDAQHHHDPRRGS